MLVKIKMDVMNINVFHWLQMIEFYKRNSVEIHFYKPKTNVMLDFN